MMISFMFHNVKQLFQTLKQEFNNNKKVALPWDISKMKNDSKRQGFEYLSWDFILFYIHTYCLQYGRVHFEYLLYISKMSNPLKWVVSPGLACPWQNQRLATSVVYLPTTKTN